MIVSLVPSNDIALETLHLFFFSLAVICGKSVLLEVIKYFISTKRI